MGRPAQDITESELTVLRYLWNQRRGSIRQITDALYPDGGPAQYATVQKLLDRLESKELVERDRSLFVHVFSPAVNRDEVIGRRLRALAETLCDGSLTPLLSHLVKARPLSDQERRDLLSIIEESGDDHSSIS